MEGLADTHKLVIAVIQGAERGSSIPTIIKEVSKDLNTQTMKELMLLLAEYEKNGSYAKFRQKTLSVHRDILYQTILSALRGEPVHKKLIELEKEISAACDENIEQFIASLPVKSMLPVLLFQFPAFLLLVLGPLLAQFLKEIQI
jgi:hypothetical protein